MHPALDYFYFSLEHQAAAREAEHEQLIALVAPRPRERLPWRALTTAARQRAGYLLVELGLRLVIPEGNSLRTEGGTAPRSQGASERA